MTSKIKKVILFISIISMVFLPVSTIACQNKPKTMRLYADSFGLMTASNGKLFAEQVATTKKI